MFIGMFVAVFALFFARHGAPGKAIPMLGVLAMGTLVVTRMASCKTNEGSPRRRFSGWG